jgi:predicted Zn-dependent protease
MLCYVAHAYKHTRVCLYAEDLPASVVFVHAYKHTCLYAEDLPGSVVTVFANILPEHQKLSRDRWLFKTRLSKSVFNTLGHAQHG